MEYGRLVVLGYSSYRVASAQAPPRSDAPPRSQSSFGLGVARDDDDSNQTTSSSSRGDSTNTAPRSSSARLPPRSATNVTSSSTRSSASRNNNNPNSNYSSSKKALGQLWEPIGTQNAQYVLQKRKRANGVALRGFHHFRTTNTANPTTRSLLSSSSSSTSSSSSSSSSASASGAHTKDMQAVTKRMMQRIDQQRARDNTNNSNSIDTQPFLLCVPMNDTDAHASVTEYALDPTCDMFQLGRLPCRQNDFVVPGPRVGASGTISRFAARIVSLRNPPFTSRVFAGGFDSDRKLLTAGHALKYCAACGAWMKKVALDHRCVATSRERRQRSDSSDADALEHVEIALSDPSAVPIDGVTKNGVRVWLPEYNQWFEVSVNGNLYAIENRLAAATTNSSRSERPQNAMRHSTFNRPVAGSDGVPSVLTDGAIIDLGGVQLQFQTAHCNTNNNTNTNNAITLHGNGRLTDASIVDQLERLNVQCPVQLHPLHFTSSSGSALEDANDLDATPHVFPACGHVFGFDARIAASHVCPLCRTAGFLVKLLLNDNAPLLESAAARNAIPECVLNPCGHAISHALATHYATLLMPNGRAICPFCAVHLHPTTPFSRLYLYSEEDDEDSVPTDAPPEIAHVDDAVAAYVLRACAVAITNAYNNLYPAQHTSAAMKHRWMDVVKRSKDALSSSPTSDKRSTSPAHQHRQSLALPPAHPMASGATAAPSPSSAHTLIARSQSMIDVISASLLGPDTSNDCSFAARNPSFCHYSNRCITAGSSSTTDNDCSVAHVLEHCVLQGSVHHTNLNLLTYLGRPLDATTCCYNVTIQWFRASSNSHDDAFEVIPNASDAFFTPTADDINARLLAKVMIDDVDGVQTKLLEFGPISEDPQVRSKVELYLDRKSVLFMGLQSLAVRDSDEYPDTVELRESWTLLIDDRRVRLTCESSLLPPFEALYTPDLQATVVRTAPSDFCLFFAAECFVHLRAASHVERDVIVLTLRAFQYDALMPPLAAACTSFTDASLRHVAVEEEEEKDAATPTQQQSRAAGSSFMNYSGATASSLPPLIVSPTTSPRNSSRSTSAFVVSSRTVDDSDSNNDELNHALLLDADALIGHALMQTTSNNDQLHELSLLRPSRPFNLQLSIHDIANAEIVDCNSDVVDPPDDAVEATADAFVRNAAAISEIEALRTTYTTVVGALQRRLRDATLQSTALQQQLIDVRDQNASLCRDNDALHAALAAVRHADAVNARVQRDLTSLVDATAQSAVTVTATTRPDTFDEDVVG